MNKEEIILGIGKLGIGYKDSILMSIGLGSCIGLVIYDKENNIGGMAHIMLPSSSESNLEDPNSTILLSEHDPKLRNELKEIIESDRFKIADEADESYETIRKYNKLTMGLVLMSRFIPKLEGIDTLKRIKEKDDESKVVLISPKADKETIDDMINKGADEVLISPFEREKVIWILKSVLYEKHARFADIAVPQLIFQIINRGGDPKNLKAKMVGGANLFSNLNLDEIGQIGDRNISAVKEQLKKYNVSIIAEDTGKNFGRTVRFDVETGTVKISTKNSRYEI